MRAGEEPSWPDVLDSHFHVWDAGSFDLPWLEMAPQLRHIVTSAEYWNSLDVRVTQAISVQAGESAEESTWLTGEAFQDAHRAVGIVLQLDLSVPRALESLSSQSQTVSDHPVVGARDPRLIDRWDNRANRDVIAANVAGLAHLKIALDLMVRPGDLGRALELLETCGGQGVAIIEHCGSPPLKGHDRRWRKWTDDVSAISEIESTFCKLSGPAIIAPVQEDPHERQYVVDVVVNAFGERRIMFGSDWPISPGKRTIGDAIDGLALLLRAAGLERSPWVWADSARTAYGLEMEALT